jgi:PAS domain S-box-containing protein
MNPADNPVSTTVQTGALPGSDVITYDAELILNAIPGGVYGADLDGRATLVNDAATRILGWTAADLIGRVLHEVIHHTRPDGSAYPIEECPLYRTLRDGETRRTEEDVYWRKDGTSIPIEFYSHPIRRDGVLVGALVTFRDITERRRGEERTHQLVREQFARAKAEVQHAQLRDVLAQAPALICVTRGPRHVIETANDEYLAATGATDLVGKTMVEAFPEVEGDHIALLDEVFASGVTRRGEEASSPLFTGHALSGRRFNHVIQPLCDDSGTVYGLLTHAVDVTAQVRDREALRVSERDLRKRADELTRLAAALERSNHELDAFAYAASHDLRAPLRGIANLAQWIEEDLHDQLRDDTREMLGLMRSRMHRMEGLIEGLLEYSRAGRVHHDVELIDTGRIVRDAVDLLSPPEGATVVIASDLPTITGERLPLQQVFLNLIGNAIKHANRVDLQIQITAREVGEFYEFAVADNGPGIDPRYQKQIWGIFQTLEARDKVEGTGIGLALVKKLVESQGGRAWVDSTPGSGATFRFLWRK